MKISLEQLFNFYSKKRVLVLSLIEIIDLHYFQIVNLDLPTWHLKLHLFLSHFVNFQELFKKGYLVFSKIIHLKSDY